MIFINNKYTKWYNSIIAKANNRIITGYTERHHIIPKSLGGNNHKTNIVRLTPKEHFVCHLLLTKMTAGVNRYKMCFALHMIANIKNIGFGRYRPSARIYELARKTYRDGLDGYWTEEQRKINSETKINRNFKHKQESIDAIRKYQKEEKIWTEKAIQTRLENCVKAAQARKGSKWSEQQKQKKFISYVQKNKLISPQVFQLADNGFNKRQISLKLGISWDRVNYILVNRAAINNLL